MMKLITGKLLILVLALVTLALIGLGGSIAYQRLKVRHVVIAAGLSKVESYVMMQALKTVVERYHPRLTITIRETEGTTDSLARLERGEVQFATAQADALVGPSARSAAVLYQDNFQLLAHKSANIAQFTDLKGKRIALPKNGIQYSSFMSVAHHYGFGDGDFTFVGPNDEASDVAFQRSEADAVFRVRALHNSQIGLLARAADTIFIPIENASAMHIEKPAYTQSIIPKGAYAGNPPIPAENLATVSTERVLLARQDVENEVVNSIIEVLMERRQEIAAAIPDTEIAVRPLLGEVRQPVARAGLDAAIHPGARDYYEQRQSVFVLKHADLLAVLLVAFALVLLWISQLRRMIDMRQKRHADMYHLRIVQMMEEVQSGTSDGHIEPFRTELMTMMTLAIRDLAHDKISDESFQTFRAVWQVAYDAIRGRTTAIQKWDSSLTAGARR